MLLDNISKRNFIRKKIFYIRSKITASRREILSRNTKIIALKYNIIKNAKHIAIFYPFNKELNTLPLIKSFWHLKKKFICQYYILFYIKNFYL